MKQLFSGTGPEIIWDVILERRKLVRSLYPYFLPGSTFWSMDPEKWKPEICDLTQIEEIEIRVWGQRN